MTGWIQTFIASYARFAYRFSLAVSAAYAWAIAALLPILPAPIEPRHALLALALALAAVLGFWVSGLVFAYRDLEASRRGWTAFAEAAEAEMADVFIDSGVEVLLVRGTEWGDTSDFQGFPWERPRFLISDVAARIISAPELLETWESARRRRGRFEQSWRVAGEAWKWRLEWRVAHVQSVLLVRALRMTVLGFVAAAVGRISGLSATLGSDRSVSCTRRIPGPRAVLSPRST